MFKIFDVIAVVLMLSSVVVGVGPSLSGAGLDMNGYKIFDVATPTNPADVSTKNYVDDHWGIGGGTSACLLVTADEINTQSVAGDWPVLHQVTNLNTLVIDTMSGWDSTNKRYVVPVSGKYYFTGQVEMYVGGSWTYVSAALRKNGNLYIWGVKDFGEYTTSHSVSGIIELSEGDYVDLAVSQTSGQNKNIDRWNTTQLQGFFLGL